MNRRPKTIIIDEARSLFENSSTRVFALAFLGLLVVGAFFSSFYTIPAESQGILLRFGKYTGTPKTPGAHFKIPLFDKVHKVPIERQLKQEFGFSTPGATNEHQFSRPDEQDEEKDMITGDRNAALVEWVIQYRIIDPEAYLFHVRDPEHTLRNLSESVMRAVVGDRTIDDVLTIGRSDIEQQHHEKLAELVERYGLGFSINQVQLKNVNPPRTVQDAFNEVNEAQQERESAINVARGEYNKAVPRAKGLADQKINAAGGYATRRINEAEGNASRFTALFTEYQKAPAVTKRRIYLETLTDVMPQAGKKIIIDANANHVLPLLQLLTGDIAPN